MDRDGPKGHSLGFDIRNALSRAPSVFFPFHLFLFFCYQNQLAPRDRNAHSTTFRLKKKGFGLLSLSDFHLEMLKQSRTHQRLSQFERNDAAYDLIMESPCKNDQISDEILLRLFKADLLNRVIYIYTRTLFERGGKKRVSQSDAVDRIIYA